MAASRALRVGIAFLRFDLKEGQEAADPISGDVGKFQGFNPTSAIFGGEV
jgi:hypothetical protein